MKGDVDWRNRATKGFLASGIDPGDRKGHKNYYIDLIQKMALAEVLELNGDERVLDFGCGSGRVSYWIAPRVKEVVGLEVTPEMIDLAEKNRRVENVAFMIYDGGQFPVFPYRFDLILSVGVLQTMRENVLKKTVSQLAGSLKQEGKFCLIEQVSDNPRIGRPSLNAYLHAFSESDLECVRHYPIRRGRWWLLHLIRYGLIPRGCFQRAASWELKINRRKKGKITYYKDFLFLLKKG